MFFTGVTVTDPRGGGAARTLTAPDHLRPADSGVVPLADSSVKEIPGLRTVEGPPRSAIAKLASHPGMIPAQSQDGRYRRSASGTGSMVPVRLDAPGWFHWCTG